MREGLTIKDLQVAKADLEKKIFEKIEKYLDDFEKTTGCSPSGISLILVDVTSLSDENKKYIISEVKVRIDLDGLI
jgi:hypothetical protein